MENHGEVPLADAPEGLVAEYVRLTVEKRRVEERLALVRAELELFAMGAVGKERPRVRFACAQGEVQVRTMRTCSFDRDEVVRRLAKLGKLEEVAVIQGPSLAKYLEEHPDVRAAVDDVVRERQTLVLLANEK